MMKLGALLALFLLLAALGGCATITALAEGPEEATFRGWPFYGGIQSIFTDPGKVYGSDYWMFGPFAWLVIAVDTVLSAGADTLLLPVTLPWALLR